MRTFYIFALFLSIALNTTGQEYNEQVDEIIGEVNLDSLVYQLRNISGEDSVVVNGQPTIIEHRVSSWGNNLAADYIYETLEGLGLEPWFQDYSANGRNVLAIQEGKEYPDEYYIICAHYDAVDFYCADDNGSGTAGVLEAARIFSQRDFEYSIIYALWDEEEIGLIGSNYYATQAAGNGDVIHAVINMDMISWDGDEDMKAEIHTSFQASSDQLADYIAAIPELYGLQVVPAIQLPGTTASDHSRFWNNGYAAVLIIEEYFGGDFNPYYHSDEDRIDILNMPYFYEMARLSIGSLASMASPELGSSAGEMEASGELALSVYPNPCRGSVTINFAIEGDEYIKLVLSDSRGKLLTVLDEGMKQQGKQSIQINTSDLAEGLYFLALVRDTGTACLKLIVQ